MSLRDYLRISTEVHDDVRFQYYGGEYRGRGIVRWDPADGFRLDALVAREGEPLRNYGVGHIGAPLSADHKTIWLGRGARRWTLIPGAFLRDRTDVLLSSQLAIRFGRLIGTRPQVTPKEEIPRWHGAALYRVGPRLHLPHPVEARETIGGMIVSHGWSRDGIAYKDETGFGFVGRRTQEEYLEVGYTLPRARWTRREAWVWPEAFGDALGFLGGQRAPLLQRSLIRDSVEFWEQRWAGSSTLLGRLAPVGIDQFVDPAQLATLTDLVARGAEKAQVVRHTLRQMASAVEQKSAQARELLIATIFEATFRTLNRHPWGSKKFDIKKALSTFQSQYLNEDWTGFFEEVFAARGRLRHRNAHPDWLYQEGGALSDTQRAQSHRDLMLLSRSYGVIVLSIAGILDVSPEAILKGLPDVPES